MQAELEISPVRILLVDDDEDDYIICRDMLSEMGGARFQLEWVGTYDATLEAIERKQHDVYLLDYRFGEYSGLDVLRQATRHGCRAPMILLTGQGDHQTDIEAMQAGAADYLIKGQIDGPLLERSIRHAITRHRAEEALRESEERFRLLVEGVRDYATFALDPEGRVVSWNAGAERLNGYPAEEVVGRHFSCFYPPEDIEAGKPERTLQVAVAAGHSEDEGWRMRKDGSRFWANVVITALMDADGQLRGFAQVARDMTERMRLEEQLRQSQKMEAVGRLAGGVAHDFNNMLGAITGYADLLLHRVGPDEMTRSCLQEILKASERATNLTRQLLAFSRRSVLAPQILDLNEVVANIHPMLRRLIGEDIELVTLPDAGMVAVKADPGQIEQVLLNLAINARDAMPQGGKLTIETRNVTESRGQGTVDRTQGPAKTLSPLSPVPCSLSPGPYVLLAVTDTGCGMDAATQCYIFEPFFTTKEPDKGTGLGLATVYGIVQHSGGQIEVESQPGVGSSFRVYLPRAEEGLRCPVSGVGSDSSDRTPDTEHQTPCSETILLVEDEPIVRKLVQEVLRMNGYTVLEAIQGDDALRLCNEHEGIIDLLLTDVMMPGMSGRELAERAVVLRPETKVLFMSGYTDDAVLRHGVSTQDIAYIQKPFKPAELAEKVRELLGTMATNGSGRG